MSKRVFGTILLILLFIGCTKTPITGRHQMILMSNDEEIQLGLSTSKEILKNVRLSRDKEATAIVKEVGRNIAKVTNHDYNTSNYQWEFNLVDNNKQANAFCLPGGKVFVFTGILKYIANTDELATVMGHEIAHALARHGAERRTSATLSKIGAGILKVLNELDNKKSRAQKDYDNRATDYMVSRWIMLPHSRTQEYEADHIGLVLSSKAGYNPESALEFWRKFSVQKSNIAEYMSTHPTPEHRIEELIKLIPKVKPYYEASQKTKTKKINRVKEFIPTAIPFFKDK
jgi:predicted Zn-dependent protease